MNATNPCLDRLCGKNELKTKAEGCGAGGAGHHALPGAGSAGCGRRTFSENTKTRTNKRNKKENTQKGEWKSHITKNLDVVMHLSANKTTRRMSTKSLIMAQQQGVRVPTRTNVQV